MDDKPTIIHAADIHLGATPYGFQERHDDIFESFSQLIDHVVEVKPAALVIAGDLFDVPKPSFSDIKRAVALIRRATSKGITVVAAHGEHDKPKRRDSSVLELMEEVVEGFRAPVLREASVSGIEKLIVKLSKLHIMVAPFEHETPERRRRMLKAVFKVFSSKAVEVGAAKVLLGHFSLDTEMVHDAVASPSDLPPVDYAALGHIHRPTVRLDSSPPYAYPGVLDPLRVDEVSHGGGDPLLVDLSTGEPVVDRLPIDRRPQIVRRVKISSSASLGVIESIVASSARGAGGRAPLIHLKVEAPRAVPKRAVLERAHQAARKTGSLVRVDFTVKGGEEVSSGVEVRSIDLSEIASRLYNLSREEAETIFQVLVPALVDNDERRAREVIEYLADKRGESFWLKILSGG